ncbi:ABC transporter permease [Limnohabitans planktonicus]|uniref:ABC transporter permease n=1 Tax=Limnohabitans planktonicus II-D5 TaxID=1293045 RepID=A0A2T7UIQ5_9BURK|nr:proline/glycine betaine ABC transporter permease [Limnohabitans planktonicus]PVE44554.1 ABC transporter permease [Limnohabitans planktonicus II-D5]
MNSIFFDLSFVDQINSAVIRLVAQHGDFFHDITRILLIHFLVPLEKFLIGLSPVVVLLGIGVLAWHALRRWTTVVALVAGLYLIGCFGLWDKLMQTLALMLVSTTLTIAIGLPMGIWMSASPRLRKVLEPVLDVMQTLPTFVYLVPVLMLFGLGKVPAVLATVIYALPPLVRLTDLGIRQVDKEVVEASRSFGSTPWQLLINVNLPLARPSIMAGLNQAVMMALAMVVIASMIGSRGLGEDVLSGINNMDMGRGLQGGFSIVILAVVIDRITQAYGKGRRERQALRQKRKGGQA